MENIVSRIEHLRGFTSAARSETRRTILSLAGKNRPQTDGFPRSGPVHVHSYKDTAVSFAAHLRVHTRKPNPSVRELCLDSSEIPNSSTKPVHSLPVRPVRVPRRIQPLKQVHTWHSTGSAGQKTPENSHKTARKSLEIDSSLRADYIKTGRGHDPKPRLLNVEECGRSTCRMIPSVARRTGKPPSKRAP